MRSLRTSLIFWRQLIMERLLSCLQRWQIVRWETSHLTHLPLICGLWGSQFIRLSHSHFLSLELPRNFENRWNQAQFQSLEMKRQSFGEKLSQIFSSEIPQIEWQQAIFWSKWEAHQNPIAERLMSLLSEVVTLHTQLLISQIGSSIVWKIQKARQSEISMTWCKHMVNFDSQRKCSLSKPL